MFTIYKIFYKIVRLLKVIKFYVLSHLDPAENELMSEMGWYDYKLMKILE